MEVTARDLAKYRLELAEEKLDVAVKLLDDKAWRDAASRAYYGHVSCRACPAGHETLGLTKAFWGDLIVQPAL